MTYINDAVYKSASMIPDLYTATFLAVFMSKSIQITVVVQRYSLLQFPGNQRNLGNVATRVS